MYRYQEQRENIFTEEGIKMLQEIRLNINRLSNQLNSFTLENAIKGCTGNSWDMLACIDYLVETGEISEVAKSEITQYRTFIKT